MSRLHKFGRPIEARFLVAFCAMMVLGAIVGCSRKVGDKPVAEEPPAKVTDPLIQHLILISVDTLRADHLACYGHPFVKTPNIDNFASEAVLFE